MTYQPHIVIIGAGITGLSTAYALLKYGMRNVRVLEQAVVNHTRCPSASISRLLRFEYGPDAHYSRMVKLSLELWQDLERQTQKNIYLPTGLLALGREDDDTRTAYEVTRSLGLPSEYVLPQHCRQRFPQFAIKDDSVITYNATGGILYASLALQTLKRAILDYGGEIAEASQVQQIAHESQARPIRLKLSSGEEIQADRVVIATGPWVHHLLPQLQLPVRATRQYLLYFAGLPAAQFGRGVFPAFTQGDLYGFPMHKGSDGLLKVASHAFGSLIDPDAGIHMENQVIQRVTDEACKLLPALRGANLAHVEACMYDVSPDENFILDRVPHDPRLIFAAGLSGHGFKFGPLLGQLLSSLVCETQPEVPLTRFRLARFSHRHAASLA